MLDSAKIPSLPDRKVPTLLVAFLMAAVFWIWAWPALRSPSEYAWDATGHLHAAQTVRDSFLPFMNGWNPQIFAGYSQGEFYPPLTHWLVALLGLVLPMHLAYRALLAAAMTLVPWAAYRFARGRGLPPNRAGLAALLVTVLFAGTPETMYIGQDIGGTFDSSLHIGLISHAVAMVLFFAAGSLFRSALGRRARIVPAAILLALSVLNHMVMGVATILLFAADTLARVLASRQKLPVLSRAAAVAAVALGLAAFWVVPMLVDRDQVRIHPLSFWFEPVIGISVVAGIVLLVMTREARSRVFARCAGTGLFIGLLLAAIGAMSLLQVSAHLYRFKLVLLVACAFLAAGWAVRTWQRRALGWVASALGIAWVVVALPTRYAPPPPEIYIPPGLKPQDRVLIVAPRMHSFAPHYLTEEFPRRAGCGALLGLFVESTPLSRWILNLNRMISFESFSWGVPLDHPAISRISSRTTERHDRTEPDGAPEVEEMARILDLFAVTHILSDRPPPAALADSTAPVVARIPGPRGAYGGFEYEDGRYVFRLYRMRRSPEIATVVTAPLRPIRSAGPAVWDDAVADWLLDPRGSGKHPVSENRAMNNTAGTPVVVAARPSHDGRTIALEIDSDVDQPVLVKVGYHRRWRGRDLSGRQLAVACAAPGFCLVRGHGTVVLEQRPRPLDIAAAIVSCLTLLGSALGPVAARRRTSRLARLGIEPGDQSRADAERPQRRVA